MGLDLSTNVDGDLNLDNGLAIASDRNRDRNIIVTRIMTVRGEVPNQTSLGVSDRYIGGVVDSSTVSDMTREVTRAIFETIGVRDTNPIVKILPIRRDAMLALVQPQKDYNDGQESTTIAGDFWTRNEEITLLDGSTG